MRALTPKEERDRLVSAGVTGGGRLVGITEVGPLRWPERMGRTEPGDLVVGWQHGSCCVAQSEPSNSEAIA